MLKKVIFFNEIHDIIFFVLNNYKRRDWDLNPGGDHSTRFPVLRLTKLDYLGISTL